MKKIFVLLFSFLMLSGSVFANNTANLNNGRYAMYQHPDFRGDKYLVDTQTGKVWSHICDENGFCKFEQMIFMNGDNSKNQKEASYIPK